MLFLIILRVTVYFCMNISSIFFYYKHFLFQSFDDSIEIDILVSQIANDETSIARENATNFQPGLVLSSFSER